MKLVGAVTIAAVGLQCALSATVCSIPELCQQRTSYHFQGTNSTNLAFSFPARFPDSICISAGSNSETFMYCTDTGRSENVRLAVPHVLRGLISFDMLLTNSAEQTQHGVKQDHFIMSVSESNLASLIRIDSPLFGVLTDERLDINISTFGENCSQMLFSVLEVGEYVLPGEVSFIHSQQGPVEPGSWFYEITPMKGAGPDLIRGTPSYGYIDFVLSPEALSADRLFCDHSSPSALADQQAQPEAVQHAISQHFATQPMKDDRNDRIDICIWSSNVMDGQKRIWMQQTDFLDHSTFSVSWILSIGAGKSIPSELTHGTDFKGTVLGALMDFPDFAVVDSPFNSLTINRELLAVVPDDGGPAAVESYHDGDQSLYYYFRERYLAANGSIDQISPAWCKDVFLAVRKVFASLQCDVVVYGNSRGFGSDFFITDVARTMGIPTATELLNLFMDPAVVPDVVIAPSLYALQHEQAMLTQTHPPIGVVISPAVDMNHFYPSTAPRRSLNCKALNSDINPCINIGFMGRLSIGKNPGLFLQAAHHILKKFSFARFVIIGDGPLRGRLEELAERLQIADKVDFRGFISCQALPSHLADVDIMMNPSLRGWSETFCIANIETMAMGIPLVTFAVGGIGEYISAPPMAGNSTWSMGDNAMVVHVADPAALAEATLHLITHPDARHALGKAARQSLQGYFNLNRQMEQYTVLYKALHAATKRKGAR